MYLKVRNKSLTYKTFYYAMTKINSIEVGENGCVVLRVAGHKNPIVAATSLGTELATAVVEKCIAVSFNNVVSVVDLDKTIQNCKEEQDKKEEMVNGE